MDSNVFIAVLRAKPGAVAWFTTLEGFALPIAVVAEIRFGALKSSEPEVQLQRIEALVFRGTQLAADGRTVQLYADLRLTLSRAGRPIPQNDLWIAASCIQHGLRLATYDDHLLALPGLSALKPF